MRAEPIPDELWPRLSEFIAESIGLHFPPGRRPDLQRGLADAAADFGFTDAATCADWLLSTSLTQTQLHTLASYLTIGETYFFRERKTFEALRTSILPELIRRRRGSEQRLRLWSAACSTGEEPYSLAILLHELLPDWQHWHVTILATDINPRFLRKAATGVYGEWSFRESPRELKERYFTGTAGGRLALIPEIRKRVTFAQMNLAQDGFPSLATDTNAMDLILCRNVLMYFTPAHAQKLVANLRRALLEGGWLSVSPSECSQALFPQFAAVNFPGAILYRKSDTDDRTVTAQATAPPIKAMEHTQLALPMFDPPKPVLPKSLSARSPRATPQSDALIPEQPTPQVFSLSARSLANLGKLTEALAWTERWIAADKLDPSAHYLHAMILQELGHHPRARHSLQRAVYLHPEFALAHFALGNLARMEARSAEANKHLHNALRLLRTRPPEEPVPESDGLTAGRLTEIICALSPPGESTP